MAAATPLCFQPSPGTPSHAPKARSVKTLVESSSGVTSIPSVYSFSTHPNQSAGSEPEEPFPIIDFSLLTSGVPDERSNVIQQLGKACKDWGFFMLVNHGAPENMTTALLDASREFFDLAEEEKREFASRDIWNPIRFGSSVDVKVEKFLFWRDFLKLLVTPQFNFPNKPEGFSDVCREYCQRVRAMARELLKGISESLGLEHCYIEKAMDLESGLQVFAANFYPRCPQPELAMGIPPHSDHSLVTFLIQNDIEGLQIQHNGKWFNVNPLPNSFLVNTGDHLEILSNGMYKSVVHRAIVNKNATRISIAIANGPSLDTVVSPAPELVDSERRPTAFIPMKFKEYLELQQSSKVDGKACLDHLQLPVAYQPPT